MVFRNTYRVVLAVLMGAAVFLAAHVLAGFMKGLLRLAVSQSLTLVLSLLAMLILGRGSFAEYGFQKARNVKWVRLILTGLGLGILATVTTFLSGAKGIAALKQLSFPQIVLFVWFLASIVEEVLTRGLVQGFLSPLHEIKIKLLMFEVNIPTLVSALFFGAMHLIVLVSGTQVTTAGIVVIYTFVLGLVAGHNRARSGSLWPAIVVHASANIGGVIGGVLVAIVKVIITGKPPSF